MAVITEAQYPQFIETMIDAGGYFQQGAAGIVEWWQIPRPTPGALRATWAQIGIHSLANGYEIKGDARAVEALVAALHERGE